MQAGNAHYRDADDIPAIVPLFPLSGALLLPGGQMPLNIFEPRYISMVDDALARHRLIGMVQPDFRVGQKALESKCPPLCEVGCIGRITSISEAGDGRYVLALQGVCRMRIVEEVSARTAYRQARVAPFAADLNPAPDSENIDREALLRTFRAYLENNKMEADWDSVARASNTTLVNALSMMSPYGPAEKQALLEAPDLNARAETLIAITEIALARESDDYETVIQ